MDHDEQRDFEEEEFNRALLEEQDWEEETYGMGAPDDPADYTEWVIGDLPDWMLA